MKIVKGITDIDVGLDKVLENYGKHVIKNQFLDLDAYGDERVFTEYEWVPDEENTLVLLAKGQDADIYLLSTSEGEDLIIEHVHYVLSGSPYIRVVGKLDKKLHPLPE